MAKKNLNDRGLKALKSAPENELYDVMDSVVPGFGVRVSDTGRKTFILLTRFPGSKNPTRRALGEYGALTLEKARQKARDWLELVRQGKDPRDEEERLRAAEQRKRANSFRAVAEDFIREKLGKKVYKSSEGEEIVTYAERKGREVENDIRREFLPAWGGRPVTDIAAFDVVQIVKAAKDRGAPYQAHNLLGTARRLFSWAIDQQAYGLETSPCDRLKPKAIIGPKAFRTRVLNDSELRALWKATEETEIAKDVHGLGYPYGPLFRMLALTGQRKSEVAEAQWSEFDLTRKLWVIPAERMKADAPHVVPLSDDVVAILKSLPKFSKGDYLFSTTYGKTPVNGFSKAKTALDKAVLAELRKADGKAKLPDFVIHDIRRTMRTGLSALPISTDVAELVIAHTRPGLRKVYDQYAFEAEKRKALELWAGQLRDIIEPPPANVVNLGKSISARAVPGDETEGPRSTFAERLAGATSRNQRDVH